MDPIRFECSFVLAPGDLDDFRLPGTARHRVYAYDDPHAAAEGD
jgi:hypothetical protein